jgi:hypothetical protein
MTATSKAPPSFVPALSAEFPLVILDVAGLVFRRQVALWNNSSGFCDRPEDRPVELLPGPSPRCDDFGPRSHGMRFVRALSIGISLTAAGARLIFERGQRL